MADRLWAIGGAVAAAVLLAVGWFFLISPQNAETAGLREQTATAENQITVLEKRIAQLKKENGDLAQYQAKLEKDRQALPTSAAQADFLRELQSADYAVKLSVSVSMGAPAQEQAGGAIVYTMPMSVTVNGTTAQLAEYVRQLQMVQPRAVLVDSVTVSSTDQGGLRTGTATLTLSLKAFVAPPPGSIPAPAQAQPAGDTTAAAAGTN